MLRTPLPTTTTQFPLQPFPTTATRFSFHHPFPTTFSLPAHSHDNDTLLTPPTISHNHDTPLILLHAVRDNDALLSHTLIKTTTHSLSSPSNFTFTSTPRMFSNSNLLCFP
ncbi:hypothetical protein AVEN_217826-1 [Araneus ventricosus]|uniref:Uncharacterized protein n=2 Tax=Araneus ventricosus TaxID=182803 RepID=A0A4Y2NUQ8_ARAVE|nr:hypothetical protein AVEN_217826-1 [Araneus ventricosus]